MSQKTKSRIAFGVACIAGIFLAGFFSQISFVQNLEQKVLDVEFRIRGPLVDKDTSIVVVGLDDQTFQSLNLPPPYPRRYYAEIIRNLDEAGARLIVFDLLFTEQSEDSLQDEEFAQAARESNKVIFAGKLETDVRGGTVYEYPVPPIPPISEPADNQPMPWGLVNVPGDKDDFVRRYFIGRSVNGVPYYGLSVLAAMSILGVGESEISETDEELMLGDRLVPKVTPTTFLINYAGPLKSFKYYSFVNILDDEDFDIGEFDTDVFDMHKYYWNTFQDKIVFVGATTAESQDIKLVPFQDLDRNEPKMPGVEVHAHALNTILTGQFLRTTSIDIEFALIPVLVLFMGVLVWWLKPFRGGLVALALILLYSVLAYLGFSSLNRVLPFFAPVFAVAFSYLGHSAYLYATEQREKKRYRQTFQKYVSESVVKQMLDTGEFPEFGGERKELTVLFSDIRQFTNFSERLAPEEVVSRLSEYLSEMTDIVLRNDGTLDKFVGDEIMAIYGAPLYYANHAEKACRTAYEMIEKLKELRNEYTSHNGGQYFDIGVGINTGDMVVGNLGSRQLFDYTVIGDAVNLGARLEGLNKFYGTQIIISESALNAAGNSLIARELDSVKVKGKDLPIRIYELLGIDSIGELDKELRVEAYETALNFYHEKRWYECLREMNRILRQFPMDGPARVYIRRCLDYMEKPPEDEWEPVVAFETK